METYQAQLEEARGTAERLEKSRRKLQEEVDDVRGCQMHRFKISMKVSAKFTSSKSP